MSPAELNPILAQRPPAIVQITRQVVGLLAGVPGLSGSIKLGWRSVNFRHVVAGHVCAVFPYDDRVALYFEHGRLLEDPEGLLQGGGLKKGRFLRLYPGAAVPQQSIALLVAEAIAVRV